MMAASLRCSVPGGGILRRPRVRGYQNGICKAKVLRTGLVTWVATCDKPLPQNDLYPGAFRGLDAPPAKLQPFSACDRLRKVSRPITSCCDLRLRCGW